MTRPLRHSVLCMLLSILYFVDCGMPCIDICADHIGAASAAAVAHHNENGDHHEAPSEHHCECHCMCACHIPALLAPTASSPRAALRELRGNPYPLSLPTTSVSPPDHIPLV
jgi:hypothetical protein